MPRDQRAANARYYRLNRASEIDRVRTRQAVRTTTLKEIRLHPCMDCGGRSLPHQMDFDHRDPKDKSFRLSSGTGMLASVARLAAEVEKCDVVCANCHRSRTQRRWEEVRRDRSLSTAPDTVRKRQTWRHHAAVLDALRDVPCQDCGRRFAPCVMDFDHRDGTTKRSGVTRMIGRAGLARIMSEVEGCDIVCANCHRERTRSRREGSSSGRE